MYDMAEETTRPEFFAGQPKVQLVTMSNFLSPLTVCVGPSSDHFFFYKDNTWRNSN
jgi:hypothetical protein